MAQYGHTRHAQACLSAMLLGVATTWCTDDKGKCSLLTLRRPSGSFWPKADADRACGSKSPAALNDFKDVTVSVVQRPVLTPVWPEIASVGLSQEPREEA